MTLCTNIVHMKYLHNYIMYSAYISHQPWFEFITIIETY